MALASASLRHQICSSSTCRSAPLSAARSPAVSVRSTAVERRAVRSTSMPTSTPSASAISARSPECERLKRSRAPGSSGLPCAPVVELDVLRRDARAAAEHDPQRRPRDGPARAAPGRLSRAARARSSASSNASRRATSSGGCARSTCQPRRTCDVCNRLRPSLARMVDKEGEGRLAPRASASCSYPHRAVPGPRVGAVNETTQTFWRPWPSWSAAPSAATAPAQRGDGRSRASGRALTRTTSHRGSRSTSPSRATSPRSRSAAGSRSRRRSSTSSATPT